MLPVSTLIRTTLPTTDAMICWSLVSLTLTLSLTCSTSLFRGGRAVSCWMPTASRVLVPYQNIAINFERDEDGKITEWTVVTEDGYRYTFGEDALSRETTQATTRQVDGSGPNGYLHFLVVFVAH